MPVTANERAQKDLVNISYVCKVASRQTILHTYKKNALIQFVESEANSSTLQLEVSWSARQRLSRFAIVLLLAQVRLSPSDFISHFISLPVTHTHGQTHTHTHSVYRSAHSLAHANTSTYSRCERRVRAQLHTSSEKMCTTKKNPSAEGCNMWPMKAWCNVTWDSWEILMLGPFLPPGMALIDFTLLEIKIGWQRHRGRFPSQRALKIHEKKYWGFV